MWCAHFVLHNILIIIEKIIVRVVCAGVVPGVLWCGMWDSSKTLDLLLSQIFVQSLFTSNPL